ncbi:uncharacterized protein LOC135937568 [Cloeon dipterum]|uniref:uncharacterized protein LOC135937568 n=1 Tax=Cloeon dipterum TaxID=197152 RepID=UPI0032208333
MVHPGLYLAPVLLGLRSALKEDLGASAAQLVYGEAVRLPGEFFSTPGPLTPSELLVRLRSNLEEFCPVPASSHAKPSLFVHPALQTSSHVMLRVDAYRKPLTPHYTGPHKVLERGEKTFQIEIKGRRTSLSIDRLKPAYAESENVPDRPAEPVTVDVPLPPVVQVAPQPAAPNPPAAPPNSPPAPPPQQQTPQCAKTLLTPTPNYKVHRLRPVRLLDLAQDLQMGAPVVYRAPSRVF